MTRAAATRAAVMVLTVLLCAVGSACPGVPRPVERPSLTLIDVAATRDTDGATLLLRLRFALANPNRIALSARALDWRFALAHGPETRGRVSLDTAIPGKRAETVLVFVRIAPQAATSLLARVDAGAVRFRLAGTLHLFSPRGDVAAPFDQRGHLAPW